MKRSRWILPLGILTAVFGLAMIVMIVRASADDLLYQAASLMAEATDGHAELTFVVETPEKSGQGTAEVWGRRDAGPNGEPAFRIAVKETDMDEAAGSVAVSDGSQVWLWNPSKNTVYVGTFAELEERMKEHKADFAGDYSEGSEYDFDRPDMSEEDWPQTPEEAVDKLLEYFMAERAGTADIGKMSANELRLIPIPEMMPDELRANGGLLNIWLRTSDSAPLAVEYAGGAVGYGKISATFLELNQGVDDAMFTFEIPEGAEVVNLADIEPPPSLSAAEADAAADFDVLMPEDLPAAARLEGFSEVRGAIVQSYRLPDGQRFTIAQGAESAARPSDNSGEAVTVRGVAGMLYSDDDGLRSLLTWSEGDVTFWVGGDLTADSALAIANSLR